MNHPEYEITDGVIKISRYKVIYEETVFDIKTSKFVEITCERFFSTKVLAEAFSHTANGTVYELDTTGYEWLDGIKVADVPDTYADAVKIYEAGQAAYEAEKNKPTPEETIAGLESQVTDLQMALCEMYETMEVMMS